jgi:hypothetical protein
MKLLRLAPFLMLRKAKCELYFPILSYLKELRIDELDATKYQHIIIKTFLPLMTFSNTATIPPYVITVTLTSLNIKSF